MAVVVRPPKDTNASDPATMGEARIFAAWRGHSILIQILTTFLVVITIPHKLPKFNTARSRPNKTNKNVTSRSLDTYNTKRG